MGSSARPNAALRLVWQVPEVTKRGARRIPFSAQVQEPMQRRQPVAPPEAETCRMGCEQLGERPPVLEGPPQGPGDHLTHLLGIGPSDEKIRCDAGRTGNEQATKTHQLRVLRAPHSKQHIAAAGLPAPRHEELVAIGTESADSVDGGSRPVRDHSLVSGSLPGRHLRGEL